MLHEYAGGFGPDAIDRALDVPLEQAWALYAACRARYGCLDGISYKDQELIARLEAVRK